MRSLAPSLFLFYAAAGRADPCESALSDLQRGEIAVDVSFHQQRIDAMDAWVSNLAPTRHTPDALVAEARALADDATSACPGFTVATTPGAVVLDVLPADRYFPTATARSIDAVRARLHQSTEVTVSCGDTVSAAFAFQSVAGQCTLLTWATCTPDADGAMGTVWLPGCQASLSAR